MQANSINNEGDILPSDRDLKRKMTGHGIVSTGPTVVNQYENLPIDGKAGGIQMSHSEGVRQQKSFTSGGGPDG